jgi:hypothetical protein
MLVEDTLKHLKDLYGNININLKGQVLCLYLQYGRKIFIFI